MRKILGVGVIALLAFLVIFSGPFFEGKLSFVSFINSFTVVGNEELERRIGRLEEENKYLREQLFGEGSADSIKVYSSAPFKSRGEIAIAAGEKDGIEIGDVVVFSGDILVGRVTKVFESSSIVTTIFDASWEMAVRIGGGETDALMQGGNELRLTLIPKDEFLEEGELVVSASQGFPYGLEVGTVKEIQETDDGVFKEAILDSRFQVKELRDVTVYR